MLSMRRGQRWGERIQARLKALINKPPLPDLKPQQLKHLQVVVFPTGGVGIDYPFNFVRTEYPAPFDCLLGEKIVHQRSQRSAKPRTYRRAKTRLFSPHDIFGQDAFERALQNVFTPQAAKL